MPSDKVELLINAIENESMIEVRTVSGRFGVYELNYESFDKLASDVALAATLEFERNARRRK